VEREGGRERERKRKRERERAGELDLLENTCQTLFLLLGAPLRIERDGERKRERERGSAHPCGNIERESKCVREIGGEKERKRKGRERERDCQLQV